MNNNPDNRNEEFNSSFPNQNESLNNDSNFNNTQPALGTYSAVPEIFNSRNTVSQDRTIPMQNKPVGNNIPSLRKASNAGTAKPESNQNASQGINIRKKPSSGRAFVEEFYSAQLNNSNTQMPPQQQIPPQQKVIAPIPEINRNEDNSIAQNNAENTQRRNVKYNYDELTKPDKKSTSIIILVYIAVVVLLLVGVIGFLLSLDTSESKDEFNQFLKNVESIVPEEDIEPEYQNSFNVTDTFNDETNVFIAQTTLPEPYIKGEPKTLKYDNATNESDFELTVYTPYGFNVNDSINLIDTAVYYEDDGYSCKASLMRGYSSTDDMLFNHIINPFDEEASFADKCATYSTEYGEATIWYTKFINRGETYAFIDMEGDGILAVRIVIFDYQNVPYNQESCIFKLEQILDSMLIKE